MNIAPCFFRWSRSDILPFVTKVSYDAYTDFEICGYPGSAAEQYARENNFLFTPASGDEPKIFCDSDLNGTVNNKDATAFQKHVAEIFVLGEPGLLLADVDSNGSANIMDATANQKHCAGIKTDTLSGTVRK